MYFLAGAVMIMGAIYMRRRMPSRSSPGAAKPGWVDMGSVAVITGGRRVLRGVGQVSYVHNRLLAVVVANQRACAEVAKMLNSKSELGALYKHYVSDVYDPSLEEASSDTLSTVQRNNLRGPMIAGHWRDPSDESDFSLCEIDLDHFIALFNARNAKVREYVRASAEKAFDELQAEEAKAKPKKKKRKR